MAVLNRTISVDEWKRIISRDIDEYLRILTAFGLIKDESDPDYQVSRVVDSGESLDDYHWEKQKIVRGTDIYIGVRLVKNDNE